MTRPESNTMGGDLTKQLYGGMKQVATAPLPGARELAVITSIDRSGAFIDNEEKVLVETGDILEESERVFTYGDEVVMETVRLSSGERCLVPLRTGGKISSSAGFYLSNIMICEVYTKQGSFRIAPPKPFIGYALCAEPLLDRLPRIETYAPRPIFDKDFILRQPGWHPESGILVHGPGIEPAPFVFGQNKSAPVLDRLPMHLAALLRDFCFRSDADIVNAVGVLLTGLLMNHFVESGKALALVDGNQPGVGKSLLVRTLGMLLDGEDPPVLFYTSGEEELQKRIGATLRQGCGSVLLIDNAKTAGSGQVSSAVIEACSVAPQLSFRILGFSENYTRPNDLIWAITMNDTRTSPDLVSRGVPIQLFWEGATEARKFMGSDPVRYARDHRLAILAELAGMVELWRQQGQPEGKQGHRCEHWAKIIGGILACAGFDEFLGNIQSAAAAFNADLDDLAALAEAVVSGNGPYVLDENQPQRTESNAAPASALSPKGWGRYFTIAKVKADEIAAAKSAQAKAVLIGKFLTRLVGRKVSIEIGTRTGTAVLRVSPGRSRTKNYFFEVRWDPSSQPQTGNAKASAEGGPPQTDTDGPTPSKMPRSWRTETATPREDGIADEPQNGNQEAW